ncbi:MAG: tetratricopeptide repeat protein [Verrucomicrobiota bacterium]
MKFFSFSFLAAGAIAFSGCHSVSRQDAAASRSTEGTVVEESEAFSRQRAEALARFAAGMSYEIRDEQEQALKEFHRASLADPSNEILAVELGRRYLRSKQPKKALEVLTLSSRQPQSSGIVFSWLARAYLENGETNSAIAASRDAIKKSPESIAGYQVATDLYLQTRQPDEVLKLLHASLNRSTIDALFFVQIGELYARLAQVEFKEQETARQLGLDILTRALRLKPANPNLRQKMADQFALLGDLKNASEIYLDLIAEFEDTPMMRDALREKLTNIYLRSKDKNKAAEQLEAIARDNPTRYPQIWSYLGTLAADMTNYAKAAEYFQRALTVNPNLEQAYFELAEVQIHLEQPEAALTTLSQARARFDEGFLVEFFTGLAYARLKDFPVALKHFTAAEIIGATDTNRLNYLFYFQVATTYERNKDYEQSVKYFEKCLELEPDFPGALNYLGYMWAERGENLEKARQMIERAVQLEPKNDAYLDSLGWVLFKEKKYEPGLKNILEAVSLSEKPDAALYEHLGDIYQAMQQNQKAREAWQKSVAIEPNDSIRKKIEALSP